MFLRNALILAATIAIIGMPAPAQDSGSTSSTTDTPPPPAGLPADFQPGGTVGAATNGAPLLPEGNPLQNLFTPQPQYPTPQSVTNPQPSFASGDDRPVTRIFSVNNNNPEKAPEGTNNMLQGVFTAQPQYITPQTLQNQYGQALNALPGYGQAKFEDLKNAGINYKVGDKLIINDGSDKPASEKAADDKSKTASASDKDKNAKDGKDSKDAKDKDKDKDKTAKDDKDGKNKDKDRDGKDKTADSKDGDKDKVADKDKEGDKDAEDKDKEAKEKEAAKADEKPVNVGAYNPVKEAIFFLNAGQPQQAIAVLANVLKKNPANAEAHYLAAISFVGLRDYKMAADEYSVVLRLVPATPLAQMAVDGLKKIGMQPTMPISSPKQMPPLVKRPATPRH